MPENTTKHAALEIPEILDSIFKFCKFKDLKSCRRVSKFWQNSAKKIWLGKAYVRIQEIGIRNDKRMSEYLQFTTEFDTSRNLPNFHITLSSNVCDFTSLHSFFELCGSQIKSLKLNANTVSIVESVRHILFKHCPNMQSLSLFVYVDNKHSGIDHMLPRRLAHLDDFDIQENRNLKWIAISPDSIVGTGISWMELLTNYPNLEGIKLAQKVTDEHVQEIFTAVNIIREQNPKKLKLKNVESVITDNSGRSGIATSLSQFLLTPDIQIETLSLTINSADDMLSIRNILIAQANTLRNLEFDTLSSKFLNANDCFLFNGIQLQSLLPKLFRLKLSRGVIKLMAFIRYMPNLRKLVIHSGRWNRSFWDSGISEMTLGSAMEDFKLGSLTELELDHNESSEGILKLIGWFPNMESIKLSLSNETFEKVCQGWPNLKSMNIVKSTVDECGITGLDDNDVLKINMSKGNSHTRPITVPRANITALKHLTSFYMRKNHLCNSPYSVLNFCSVVHGFRGTSCANNVFVKGYPVNEDLWKLDEETGNSYRRLS